MNSEVTFLVWSEAPSDLDWDIYFMEVWAFLGMLTFQKELLIV